MYSFNNPKPELVDWEHLWYLKAVFSDNPDLKKSTEDRYKNEIALNFPLWKR